MGKDLFAVLYVLQKDSYSFKFSLQKRISPPSKSGNNFVILISGKMIYIIGIILVHIHIILNSIIFSIEQTIFDKYGIRFFL